MRTRRPVVADQFYPGARAACLEEVKRCIASAVSEVPLPDSIVAGIVPHAGWMFSGALAALVFDAVRQKADEIETFIVFGAAHGYFGATPAVDDSDAWETPLGVIPIDRELGATLVAREAVVPDALVHRSEHSIEVQVPFIQHLFPNAKLLPIVVGPSNAAIRLGKGAAQLVANHHRRIVYIGSTDLTHYGPRYGFTPMGIGTEGLDWASTVNDQHIINAALRLEPERVLTAAVENCNACGPGAVAATAAAAAAMGKTEGHLLAYTTSNEVMLAKMGTTSQDSVGYAAIVY